MNGSQPPNGYSPGLGENYDDSQTYSPGYGYPSAQNSDWGVPHYPSDDVNTAVESDNFDSSSPAPSSSGGLSENSAPVLNLVPSLVLAIVSVLLSGFLTFSSITPTDGLYRILSLTAWGAAGLIGITAMSLFFLADTKRRAQGFYQVVSWKQMMYYATTALLFIAVVWSAIEIGLWVGKL